MAHAEVFPDLPRSSQTVQGADVQPLPGRALSLLRVDIPPLFPPSPIRQTMAPRPSGHGAAWPGSTADVGSGPHLACLFPGPSPCMAVQAGCFSKGLKPHSALSHCKMGTFSGAFLGMLAHMASLAGSPAGMAWNYFWLPASGVSLNGPAVPALSGCLSLARVSGRDHGVEV